jgi:hypothetical protein
LKPETLKREFLKLPFKNIFFDVGNTLLFPNRARILAPLHAKGVEPSLEQLHDVERRTKREFDQLVKEGNADHSFWWMFYTSLLEENSISDHHVRDQLVTATRQSANWDSIFPQIELQVTAGVNITATGTIEKPVGPVEEGNQ